MYYILKPLFQNIVQSWVSYLLKLLTQDGHKIYTQGANAT